MSRCMSAVFSASVIIRIKHVVVFVKVGSVHVLYKNTCTTLSRIYMLFFLCYTRIFYETTQDGKGYEQIPTMSEDKAELQEIYEVKALVHSLGWNRSKRTLASDSQQPNIHDDDEEETKRFTQRSPPFCVVALLLTVSLFSKMLLPLVMMRALLLAISCARISKSETRRVTMIPWRSPSSLTYHKSESFILTFRSS